MRKLMTGGSIFLLTLAAAGPALAEIEIPAAFCPNLKEVVAETSQNFARFRGPLVETSTDDEGYVSNAYASSLTLAGATLCVISEYKPPDSKALISYRCEWLPVGVTKSDVVAAVAIAVRRCVGIDDWMDHLDFYENDIAQAAVYTDEFEVTISAGTAPRAFLWVRD